MKKTNSGHVRCKTNFGAFVSAVVFTIMMIVFTGLLGVFASKYEVRINVPSPVTIEKR